MQSPFLNQEKTDLATTCIRIIGNKLEWIRFNDAKTLLLCSIPMSFAANSVYIETTRLPWPSRLVAWVPVGSRSGNHHRANNGGIHVVYRATDGAATGTYIISYAPGDVSKITSRRLDTPQTQNVEAKLCRFPARTPSSTGLALLFPDQINYAVCADREKM